MVWFVMDDGIWEHPKVLAIPRRVRFSVMGVWSMAGVWCAGQLTDGRFTTELILEKGGRLNQIEILVQVGLWHDSASSCTHSPEQCPGIPAPGSLTFHDWFVPQRSRARVMQVRENKQSAGAAGGRASGASRRSKTHSNNEAPASRLVQPPNPHPVPNPPHALVDLVCRRIFADAPRPASTPQLLQAWQAAAGAADVETELRNFLIHNADTHLRNPSAALLGWLTRAAERAATPGPKPVLGCYRCNLGWLPDEVETGMPVPCPTCKPHRYAIKNGA